MRIAATAGTVLLGLCAAGLWYLRHLARYGPHVQRLTSTKVRIAFLLRWASLPCMLVAGFGLGIYRKPEYSVPALGLLFVVVAVEAFCLDSWEIIKLHSDGFFGVCHFVRLLSYFLYDESQPYLTFTKQRRAVLVGYKGGSRVMRLWPWLTFGDIMAHLARQKFWPSTWRTKRRPDMRQLSLRRTAEGKIKVRIGLAKRCTT